MSDRDGNELLTEARRVMQPFLDTLASKPHVQAIYILSSSARCASNPTRFDKESDFDVSLVLDIPMATSEWRPSKTDTYRLIADRIPDWVPNFLFYVPVPWGAMEVNIHQLIFQYESDPRTVWDGQKCDTYLTKREVVVDRDRLFAQLIEQKANAGQAQLSIDHSRLANRITWDIREMPLRQARRLGTESGHYILNIAIDEVVDCVYAARGQFVPNKKWKLAHLHDRSLVTSRQSALLRDSLRCDPLSMEDLERRIDALERFCHSVDDIAISGPQAQRSRTGFHSRIQLRKQTLADSVSAQLTAPVADTVRDIVNYSLCGSSIELADSLNHDSIPESWQPVVPHIRECLKQPADGGSTQNAS